MTSPGFEERFWSHVDRRGDDECWPWMGGLANGYGRFAVGSAMDGPTIWNAHRVSFVLAGGALLAGIEIDHACHTADTTCVQGAECPHRRCVNPAHLDPVSHHGNALRREARMLRCKHGHWRTAENRGPNGSRTKCRVCHRIRMRNFRATGVYAFPEAT